MNTTYVSSELLLEAGAVNGISLRLEDRPAFNSMKRNGTVSGIEAENRKEFFTSLGFDDSSVARCEQVHGDNVCIVESPTTCSGTDGLITVSRGLVLAVSVADCVPVLIYDRRLKAAAAVHSGWRGTVKNVVGRAVKLLVNELNSKPEDVLAFIGPSAGACCYEVGEDVAMHFGEQYLLSTEKPGKWKLELKSAIASQLVREGVPPSNIEKSGSCTICDRKFHSFRRDGTSSGRMLAAIAVE